MIRLMSAENYETAPDDDSPVATATIFNELLYP
jgi:hypothetical protein